MVVVVIVAQLMLQSKAIYSKYIIALLEETIMSYEKVILHNPSN
jgi:hypothetical protein